MLCNSYGGYSEAYNAGALGVVMRNEPYLDVADIVTFPALLLNATEHDLVLSYVNSTKYYFS